MNIILHIIGIYFLFIPLLWELDNDKNGDAHQSRGIIPLSSKKVDVAARLAIATIAALLNLYLNGIMMEKSIFLSFSIHFLLFDYIIAYILIKNGMIKGHWFSYMGSKGMDNIKSWKNIPPILKLSIRLIVFIIAVIIYFN